MNVNQCHPAVLRDPIEFSHPDFRRLLFQQYEEREVLRKGIRKFNVTAGRRLDGWSLIPDRFAIWIRDPEGKDCVPALGLRFEWIRIESGRIVLHVEVVQPIEITQHEPRSESRRSPLARISIDSRGVPREPATRGKEMAVVFKIVYPNLEAVGSEFLPQFNWDAVAPFWNKIKGRAESELLLQFHQGPTSSEPGFALDVVRQNKRKFFVPRPAWPVFRCPLRARHNRPYVADLLA